MTFEILGSFAGIRCPKTLWEAEVAPDTDPKLFTNFDLIALKVNYGMRVFVFEGGYGRFLSFAHSENPLKAGLYFFHVNCGRDPCDKS